MTTQPTDLEALCARMAQHPAIQPRLVAVLWIGSASRGIDMHDDSDLDVQIIMDHPHSEAISGLAEIFKGRHEIDLSIVYRRDIQPRRSEVNFQDGTKGPFFVYVLASAQTLFGTNPYHLLLERLTLEQVRPSVMFTIREYLARLRVMVVQGLERPYEFKKYSIKFFKDVLVCAGALPLMEMPATTNREVLELAQRYYEFPPDLRPALDEMFDFASPYSAALRVRLLVEYEKITDKLST